MVNIIVISWEEAQEDHPTGKWTVIGSTIETWGGTVSNEALGKRLSKIESTKPVEVIALKPSSLVNTGGITRLPLTQENLTLAIAEKHGVMDVDVGLTVACVWESIALAQRDGAIAQFYK